MEERPSLGWPSGQRAALVLSFDVDGQHGEIAHHGAGDWYWRSQAGYGLETGIWRILRLLDDFDVKATFCWVGLAAEERPQAVQAARDAGHEIACHGWDHRAYRDLSLDEQRADIELTRDTLERITGRRPFGHKTPFWRFTEETPGILQRLGFRWQMDFASRDQPWLVSPDPNLPPLVQLAPSRLLDDYSYFVDWVMPPSHAFELWRDELDVIRADGGLMCLTLHPWITGRPAPSRALSLILDYAISLGDVWLARADHVALWWLERSREQGGTVA